MDTVVKSGYPAIMVDYDAWRRNEEVRAWLETKSQTAMFVLVVTDPEIWDYDPNDPDFEYYGEPAMVIRNKRGTGKLKVVDFKRVALTMVQSSMGLVPVVAIDEDHAVLHMYRQNGIILAIDPVKQRGTMLNGG